MSREIDESIRLATKALDQLQDGITKVTIRDMCESIKTLAIAVENLQQKLEGTGVIAPATRRASTRTAKPGSTRKKL